jgi:hypothetical protein
MVVATGSYGRRTPDSNHSEAVTRDVSSCWNPSAAGAGMGSVAVLVISASLLCRVVDAVHFITFVDVVH